MKDPKIFGRFRLLEKLGEGATAVVYRATSAGIECALKVFKAEFLRRLESTDFFEFEQRLMRQEKLRGHDCPCLVDILDAQVRGRGEFDRAIQMRLLDGNDLDEIRKHQHTWPHRGARTLISQVAEAARFLRDEGLCHRDIKPLNIRISNDGSRAVLLDLGVVKPTTEKLQDWSSGSSFVGTLRYSPPELLSGVSLTDQQYDKVTVYQLGAVLYELITGKQFLGDIPNSSWPSLVQAIGREGQKKIEMTSGRKPISDLIELANLAVNVDAKDRTCTIEDFITTQYRLTPTTIFVFTGGTIGAVGADKAHIRSLAGASDDRHDLIMGMARRSAADLKQLDPYGRTDVPEAVWFEMPESQQLLSENAGPEHWANLQIFLHKLAVACVEVPFTSGARTAEEVKLIKEVESARIRVEAPLSPDQFTQQWAARYTLGIVVLHGTDTMAFSMTSLLTTLKNLPCSIVFTGSNTPADVGEPHESDCLTSRSDAWKNLLLATQFLEQVGHRTTEVYLAFAGAINHGVNIRKVTIDDSLVNQPLAAEGLHEPFCYRNKGPQRRYMFKNIDGLWCNNFYPTRTNAYDTYRIDARGHNRFRHLRVTALTALGSEYKGCYCLQFDTGVSVFRLSPSFGRLEKEIDAASLIKNVSAVLIEGYHSGTFPTDSAHPFAQVLSRLVEARVPVLLVSQNGLVPARETYMTARVKVRTGKPGRVSSQEIRVIRLFGVIAETAAPLVGVAIADVRGTGAYRNASYLARLRLIEKSIRRYQRRHPDIMSDLLGDVLDREMQWDMLLGEQVRKSTMQEQALLSISRSASRKPIQRTTTDRNAAKALGAGSEVTMLRSDFYGIVERFMSSFAAGGVLPEAFDALADIGCAFGMREFSRREADIVTELGRIRSFARDGGSDPESRKRLVAAITAASPKMDLLLSSVVFAISESGMASVGSEKFEIIESTNRGAMAIRISLLTSRSQYGDKDGGPAPEHFSESDVGFFRTMRSGGEQWNTREENRTRLARLLQGRLDSSWLGEHVAAEWAMTGVLKGILFSFLTRTAIDQWCTAVSSLTKDRKARGERLLRQSIAMEREFLPTNETRWTCTYWLRKYPAQ